jgi:hypothetical protein
MASLLHRLTRPHPDEGQQSDAQVHTTWRVRLIILAVFNVGNLMLYGSLRRATWAVSEPVDWFLWVNVAPMLLDLALSAVALRRRSGLYTAVAVVAPHVLPLFGPFNPQVLRPSGAA